MTKKAPVTFAIGAKKITCTSTGKDDGFGNKIWIDSDGNEYTLSFATSAKRYAFLPRRK